MSTCSFAILIDPETYANGMPYDELKRIRDDGPKLYMEYDIRGVPYWLITVRGEIDYISKNPKVLSSEARSVLVEEWAEEEMVTSHRSMTTNMDPPRHLKNRRKARSSFSPSAVDSYAGSFRAYAKRIIDKVASRGECQFVEEVATQLPLLAISELRGIPPEDRKDFFQWTNT